MTNLYRKLERRDRALQDAVDATHNTKFWLADLFAGIAAVILFWR